MNGKSIKICTSTFYSIGLDLNTRDYVFQTVGLCISSRDFWKYTYRAVFELIYNLPRGWRFYRTHNNGECSLGKMNICSADKCYLFTIQFNGKRLFNFPPSGKCYEWQKPRSLTPISDLL